MVGIVIVAHSAKLAAGVQELAEQMVPGSAKIAIAAGIEDPENPLGTDPMQVYQAIESVYSDDGVVVLMDLGSAILSAEMALEFLPAERREKIKLCAAPLVEGAIAAIVQAASGANLTQVLAEAQAALITKASQLSQAQGTGSREAEGVGERGSGGAEKMPHSLLTNQQEIHLTIQNQMGLHARPAAKFVTTASRFQSHTTIRNISASSEWVNAKSINQVITLGVRKGHQIAIASSGVDATAALTALQQLAATNFGEKLEANSFKHSTSIPSHYAQESLCYPVPGQLCGIPASPGIAIGNIVLHHTDIVDVIEPLLDDPKIAWQQLQTAIQTAKQQINSLRLIATSKAGETEAAIFDAHLLYLEDPTVIEQVKQIIFDECLNAAAAWKTVIDQTISSYHTIENSYLQNRWADVMDVGQRVLRLLTGVTPVPIQLKQAAILVTNDLTPSQTAQLDQSKVLGICTVIGGANSHTGILARSLNIPAVVGVGEELLRLKNGTLIALDGETGQVWIEPSQQQIKKLQAKQKHQLTTKHQTKQQSKVSQQQVTLTRDDYPIKIMANLSGLTGIHIVTDVGAEGVGLLRSEFLFLERSHAPTEEEQLQTYEAIAQIIAPHPVIIRTLDIGGDKPLPYLNLGQEANPFLGYRGIRCLLDNPELLKTQLRAILRTSDRYPIKVMFPMVASVKEIRAAKEILNTVKAELNRDGIAYDAEMQVGIMIEVPAAVVVADRLATEVDFFSIGTNDLSQYVMAADRNNPKVATLADAFEPPVLRMIQQTVTAAHEHCIWVGVCGELASSPLAAPILIGLGVDKLSMNPTAIASVKETIAQLTMPQAEAIAQAVLQLDSAAAVKDYVATQIIS